MTSQTATLYQARLTAAGNARRTGKGAFRPALLVATVVGVALVGLLGHAAAPSLLAVPSELATPDLGGRGPVAGDNALEAAFWLDALLGAFFAFRVMESLFRAERVRALELLPVRPGPIFAERSVNALLEAVALALALSVFFVPLAWHGAPTIAALCAAMGMGTTVCTACVTIGTNAWMGAQYGGASGFGDAYGGHGGAFIYAPVVSFALAIVCVLMLQLGAREVLHAGEVTNAFWLASGLAVGGAFFTLLIGARHFVASYHRVAAFFREADEVGFRAVMDYQESSWVAGYFETGMTGPARFVVRRHAFQFSRRYPVARTVVVIGSVAGVLAAGVLSAAAFPSWAVALVPAVLVVVLERPFSRLDDDHLGGKADQLLPLDDELIEAARLRWTLAEIGRVALPYAIVAGAVRGLTESPVDGFIAATSLSVALAVAALVAIARRLGQRASRAGTVVSVTGCVALAAAMAASAITGAAISALLATGAIAVTLSGSWEAK